MNKKILMLCLYCAPYGGNFIASLLALDKQISKTGHQVVYAFPLMAKQRFWANQLILMGKEVLFIDFSAKLTDFVKQLNLIIQNKNVEILHCHFASVFRVQFFNLFYNRKVRLIIHLHSDFSCGKKSIKEKLINFINYKLMSRKTTFISVSNKFNFYANNMIYIPNALCLNRFNDDKGIDIRNMYHIANTTKIVLTFGWSPFVKGIDISAEAIKLLNINEQKYVLCIVCGREVTKEKMKNFIKTNTSLNGDEPYLIYLEPIENVFVYHQQCDYFLSASRSEGFPYSVIEALSCNKKCIISDIDGTKWALKYNNCFSFSSTDKCDCKNAFMKAEKTSIDINTKNLIKKDFSIDDWCLRLEQIYENI